MARLPTIGAVVALATVLGSIPLLISYANFGVHAAAAPEDVQNNTARAGDVMIKGVENELPWWTDPVGFLLLCVLAFLILLGIAIARRVDGKLDPFLGRR